MECECGCGRSTNIAKLSSTAKGWVKGRPLRFVLGHANRGTARPLRERWDVDANGCWIWNGAISRYGYGVFNPCHAKVERAHRRVYQELVGPIPEGLVLDHLCRVKACVNPAHLEPVTTQENTRRHWASI